MGQHHFIAARTHTHKFTIQWTMIVHKTTHNLFELILKIEIDSISTKSNDEHLIATVVLSQNVVEENKTIA